MSSSSQSIFQDYCDTTKTTFFLNITAILLIFIFILSPVKLIGYKQYIGKMLIVMLLGYSLYISVTSSYSLFSINDILENGSLGTAKYNLLLNALFCICLFIFIVYIVKYFFE